MTQPPSQHPSGTRTANCRELLEHASEYLEAELTVEELERLRRHLESCVNCRGFVATLNDTVAMLHSLPSRNLPPDLKAKLLQACKQHPDQA